MPGSSSSSNRSRVRPLAELARPDASPDSFYTPFLSEDGRSRSGRDHLLRRQAFLRSYQFSVKESFADRVQRSLREFDEVAKAALVSTWRVCVVRIFHFRVREGMRDLV
ncbi:hypothetical protein QJS10_CPA16g00099 [Acorus calamus]|uniref:Uncharacterized protein n=1 Tax=Acorus calamus TaxID=4465 RepID=A0AAV9CYD6_ACOCL|nr:hypothetical protein QJS10_CPA16g00099 [Acorus calamus]